MINKAKTSKVCYALLFGIMTLITSCSQNATGSSKSARLSTAVALDQEIKLSENKVVNSSTQSINRYSSTMRDLETAVFEHYFKEKKLDFSFTGKNGNSLDIKNIDIEFICPQLPYKDIQQDKFDIANLILAEYSRNGIGIPIQNNNDMFAQVSYTPTLFNDDGEYVFEGGRYQPNPGVLPKRISLVNNCLRPGLWEFSASDAVGEMYHSWFTLEKDFYYDIVSNQTGIEKTKIPGDFNDPALFDKVELQLDRLRTLGSSVGEYDIQYNSSKVLGGYSTQDSRRKVQRKFFEIERNDAPVKITQQAELQDGDKFSMFSFQEPGIYDPKNRMKMEFNRSWSRAEVYKTTPKTSYDEKQEFLPSDYLEIRIFDKENTEAIVLGNIPSALLSFKNDFVIPAFGAGVFLASEPIERRLLRTTVGPHPSFAYLATIEEDKMYMVNNHLFGYEQIFIRPIQKEDDIYLRITLVSYERITDLIEFEIKVNNMKEDIIRNNTNYSPPIYETYQDDNTL